MKKYYYTDKSVRDHHQQAVFSRDTITIIAKVGTKQRINLYTIDKLEWNNVCNSCGNPAYNIRQFIKNKLPMKHFDSIVPECICLTERIIDSQIHAIKEVLRKVEK